MWKNKTEEKRTEFIQLHLKNKHVKNQIYLNNYI